MFVGAATALLALQGVSRAGILAQLPDPLTLAGPYAMHSSALNRRLTSAQTKLLNEVLTVTAPELRKAVASNAFGVSEADLRKMCLAVTREAIKDVYTLPGTTDAKTIAAKLKTGVDALLPSLEVEADSALADRLRAQAFADWTRTRLLYDQTYFTVWDEARKVQGDQSSYVLGWQPRRAVCGGIQVTFRDLARAAGLQCRMITCQTRGRNNAYSPNANHTVVVLTLKNGLSLPFDGSSSTVSLADAQSLRGAIQSCWSLPISLAEVAVFVAYRHQHNENDTSFGDKQNEFRLTTASVSEWRNWNVTAVDRFEPKPLLESGFFNG